jgi:hypothetical protein
MARVRAPQRSTVQVDERTAKMTEQALRCRDEGHSWRRIEPPPNIVRQNWKNGFVERVRECACGCEWRQVYERHHFIIIENKRTYPKVGYLVAPGTGRLPRNEARKAAFVRDNSDLVLAA